MNTLKLQNLINRFLILSGIITLAACGNTKNAITQPGENVEPSHEQVIWVNSYKSDCSGMHVVRYYFLTQEGTEKPGENWDCVYENILGFDFEPGYIYQLKVKSFLQEGRPALELLEIVQKERDPKYFRIYDIWALTHMDTDPLETSVTRPNMEINLNTMKVMGTGMCNQYSGDITRLTVERIQFSPLAGTKKMCPELNAEEDFLEAMKRTRRYTIQKNILTFYDNYNEEVLRFQKVD